MLVPGPDRPRGPRARRGHPRRTAPPGTHHRAVRSGSVHAVATPVHRGRSSATYEIVITDDAGGRMFVCSDTDYCASRRAEGHVGRLGTDERAA